MRPRHVWLPWFTTLIKYSTDGLVSDLSRHFCASNSDTCLKHLPTTNWEMTVVIRPRQLGRDPTWVSEQPDSSPLHSTWCNPEYKKGIILPRWKFTDSCLQVSRYIPYTKCSIVLSVPLSCHSWTRHGKTRMARHSIEKLAWRCTEIFRSVASASMT